MKLTRLFMILIIAACIAFPVSVFAEPITINWWHAMRSARGKVVEKMIGDFNASQSEYKVVGTNKGNYDETMNAGVAAFRAKKQPHILQVFEVGTQTMMLSGAVYPVFELMEEAGIKVDWSRYLQAVLSYYMNSDGNLMSMPFNSSTPIMYYNADMLKKAGIAPLSKSDPITWDELGEITKKLVEAKIAPAGMVTAWQSWTQIENYSAIHNIAFASKANGYEGLDCELEINNPLVVNHITRLKSWADDNRFMYGGQKYQGPKSEFMAQNAAFYIDSISGIAKLKKGVKDFKWDAAPLPVEAGTKKLQNSIIGGASLWVLNGHSKEEYKGVAAFLKFLSNNDMQEYWHKETGYFPITIDAYDSLKSKGYYKTDPLQEVGISQLNRAIPTKISRGLRLGYFVQIRNIINEELEQVWNGKKSPQEALDNAAARSNIQLRTFEKTYK
ncbi:MAG: sn-glycerol-3-phosphate ABC transporter substrate-binding protein UgpB [Desulfobacula sp.]|jgi:sn-glycerol 3-phosphate transport system substrate-binding protein|uniref:sn-glycerol-3-phosphate ABC transporter substrate-binding protein UgpB n=1 Tax=Desulfobacula sp. TaxID=2593537 RepID=UPI001D30A0FC|nr:sn-glycerol-3-phosphate ABC transporter substrate-binding protein UgpB [Desulfobacula sp.]MBT3485200.1 sn-glycerol-3-phosphate ABC transporter substrate-binding protein UgpB [Desulfobacula sp.]MBT3804794.1 sn-glycerol-3-phosphate ABC transporter substrate-binding protein UgpB [Desulfobacula sp.]MBT4025271.1 sn-glycerol-3-phosphate ABC transporter substrate-binding protein UgpB [Desulfobacula sp.]MBT4200143.1 sn-glycerol-3-phosphate ABC transporter substrate-binding protein UgpB [Desulfobacul